MRHDIVLSDEEWTLLGELLAREQKQLLVELRHTGSAAYRAGLKARLAAIDSLTARFSPAEALPE